MQQRVHPRHDRWRIGARPRQTLGDSGHVDMALAAQAHAKASVGKLAEEQSHLHTLNRKRVVHQAFAVFFLGVAALHLLLAHRNPRQRPFPVQVGERRPQQAHFGGGVPEINIAGTERGVRACQRRLSQTRYEDVLRVAQDWRTFSSDYRMLMEAETFSAGVGDTPPISTDPPLQRDFRRLMNPFLSPQAMAGHEPKVREIVTELIDDFIEDGHCDLASQMAYLLPPRMLYRVVFGIDDEDQLQRTLEYNKQMIDAVDPVERGQAAGLGWTGWTS